jgi:mRNA interferase MazF
MASRGEVWLVDLNPTRGHEQAGTRPALVVSADEFNRGPAGLAIVVPMTTTERGIPLHVSVDPPEGGLDRRSFIKCEDVRPVSEQRLVRRFGVVSHETLSLVADRLRIVLDL